MKVGRKILTSKEAHDKMQSAFQSISAHIDVINYWTSKKKEDGKFHIDYGDVFILNIDKLSPQELIDMCNQKIENLYWKIVNDYGRFTKVKNTLG